VSDRIPESVSGEDIACWLLLNAEVGVNKTLLNRRAAIKASGLVASALVAPKLLPGSAQDEVTIRFWNGGIFPIEDANDKSRAKEDFYVYKAAQRFMDANPGVKVEVETIPGDTDMFTKYRTASVAENGPDVMGMWSGTYMLSLKDFLEPLGPYFTTEERSRITGWEATNEDFDPDSPDIYGVPAGSDGVTVLFYDKSLLEGAGVTSDVEWQTDMAGFVSMLGQINESGITPMTLDENAIIWQILMWWIGQTVDGSVGIGQLNTGERNFSDPEIVNIVSEWQKLYGYTIEGAETMDGPQRAQLFFAGEAAMTSGGFWDVTDFRENFGDNLAMVKMPNFSAEAPIQDGGIGGPGTAFIVSNYSDHKDEAVDFIKFLMTAEEQALKAESGEGSLLNVTDVDTTEYYADPFKQLQQEWANEPSVIFWADNVLNAELTSEIKAQSQLAWTGEISAEEFMQRVDEKRDELIAG
jgi:raffinose/stachyose/melibiose transport system substrate-binding protein